MNEDKIVAVDELHGSLSPSDPRNGGHENRDNDDGEEGTKKESIALDNGPIVRVFKDNFLLEKRQQDSHINTNLDNEPEASRLNTCWCCFNKTDMATIEKKTTVNGVVVLYTTTILIPNVII